jgi:ribonuclease HI
VTLRELAEALGAARIVAGDPLAPVERVVLATAVGDVPGGVPSGVAIVVEEEPAEAAAGPLIWADAGIDAAAAELLEIEAAAPLVRFPLPWRKLVTFVPEGDLAAVRAAVFAAGAGRIGAYEHCSFELPGTGTFRPLAGAHPVIGEIGVDERAREVRLEAVYPVWREEEVVDALVGAHSYDEPAFDLVPLANVAPARGRGRLAARDGERVAVWVGESARADVAAAARGARRLPVPAAVEAEARRLAGERLAGERLAERCGLAVDAGAAGPAGEEESSERVVVRVDGGSRGNPGPAAIGYRIETPDGRALVERGEPIGVATNNVAEYRALLAALRAARELGAREVEVRADSELLTKQMTGVYRVRHAGLRALWEEAQALADGFDRVRYRAVPRRENADADRLVNEALDRSAGARV